MSEIIVHSVICSCKTKQTPQIILTHISTPSTPSLIIIHHVRSLGPQRLQQSRYEEEREEREREEGLADISSSSWCFLHH